MGTLIGFGTFGEVVLQGGVAIKRYRRYPTANVGPEQRASLEWLMETSREKIATELLVYQHLGPHEGIVTAWPNPVDPPSICMTYLRRGTLEQHLRTTTTPPDDALQRAWCQQLAAAVGFCHARNVIVGDVASRNCLLTEASALQLCDFGEAAILPTHVALATVHDHGASVRTDMAQAGCVMYEIWTGTLMSGPGQRRLTFIDAELDDWTGEDETVVGEWARPEHLPATDGFSWGTIVAKCWGKSYRDMTMLLADIDMMSSRAAVNNTSTGNQTTLHRPDGCIMDVKRTETASVLTNNCYNGTDDNAGCGVQELLR